MNNAGYILDGLLMNETGRRVREQYADTGGFTDHVFAACSILGYAFVPRIRDLPSKRQAAPFAKTVTLEPKRPGRRAGAAASRGALRCSGRIRRSCAWNVGVERYVGRRVKPLMRRPSPFGCGWLDGRALVVLDCSSGPWLVHESFAGVGICGALLGEAAFRGSTLGFGHRRAGGNFYTMEKVAAHDFPPLGMKAPNRSPPIWPIFF